MQALGDTEDGMKHTIPVIPPVPPVGKHDGYFEPTNRMTDEQRDARIELIRIMLLNQVPIEKMADKIGVTRQTLWQFMDRHGLMPEARRRTPT